MASASAIAAEARGLTKAAKSAEEAGNIEQARALYLQAAGKFNEASALTSDKVEKNTQSGLAKHFYDHALTLGNQPSAIGGAPLGKEEKLTKEDLVVHEKPNIRFNDIGGLDSVKEELKKAIIYPFTHRKLYEYYNQKPGGGVLLYGPPGCGKTMIAKAAACECGADFINVETSTIMSKWVGESEKSIKNIFEVARECERAIIFFDEFDAVGGRRSEIEDYAKRIVNELLQQMDGMTKNDNILVLAATNEPWAIDPALRRPGRLKKLVFIPPPDLDARKAIFEIYLRKLPLEADVNARWLAEVTQGFSGADIAAVCSDASELPLQEALAGKLQRNINKIDFEHAMKGRRSSIIPWIRMAIEQVKKSREEDLFSELLKIGESYAIEQAKPSDRHVRSEPLQLGPDMISRIISGTNVRDDIVKSVLNIAAELSNEGREGKHIGTAFLLGDSKAVLENSRQLVLNPFEGHEHDKRLVTNPDIWENIKEFAQLDGAFIISDDGFIESAGRYLTADASKVNLPKGFGTRHSSVAAITMVTNAIGIVVSQSGGGVRIIKKGRIEAKI